LTGEDEGLELDIAVPAIEQGAVASAHDDSGLSRIPNARERAVAFAALIAG
jgi:hypothetical protein